MIYYLPAHAGMIVQEACRRNTCSRAMFSLSDFGPIAIQVRLPSAYFRNTLTFMLNVFLGEFLSLAGASCGTSDRFDGAFFRSDIQAHVVATSESRVGLFVPYLRRDLCTMMCTCHDTRRLQGRCVRVASGCMGCSAATEQLEGATYRPLLGHPISWHTAGRLRTAQAAADERALSEQAQHSVIRAPIQAFGRGSASGACCQTCAAGSA